MANVYYYGLPQRRPGHSDGQYLAQPAPGVGVYPPDGTGTPNPMTGMPFPVGTMGYPISPSIPIQPPYTVEPPPSGSQSLDIVATSIIQAPTGGQAAAITGATTLANAYAFNLSGVTAPTPIVPSSASNAVSILSYSAVSPGVFRRFGIHVFSAMGLRAIRIQLMLNGSNFPGLTEIELAHFFEGNEVNPVFIPFQKQDFIEIRARNLDLQSSYLVTARMTGWRYSGV